MPLGYVLKTEEVLAYYGLERQDIAEALFRYGSERKVTMTDDPGTLGRGGGETGFRSTDEILNRAKQTLDGMEGKVPRRYPAFHGTLARYPAAGGIIKRGQKGADVVFDIDVKGNYKEAFKEGRKILDFLDSYNAPYRIKFSGGSGPHIIIPYEAFPESLLNGRFDRVHSLLFKTISSRSRAGHIDGSFTSMGHFYRMPYSLNENSGMASLPLRREQYDDFTPSMAEISNVQVDEEWFKEPDEEAKEALTEIIRDGMGRRSKELGNVLRKSSGEQRVSGLRDLQKRIEEHAKRLQMLTELQAPAKVIRMEKQMLREAENTLKKNRRSKDNGDD